MIKRTYFIDDARWEIRELKEEGYNFNQIRIFLNDLLRGKDITRDEYMTLFGETIELFD